MASIHRLNPPPASYFLAGIGGPIPNATYDFINNPIANGHAPGVYPSPSDLLAKVGGPNEGTYFIAFGEDGTSFDANRHSHALSEGVDFLDNILNESFPRTTSTTLAAFGGGATFTLTGDIFVGAVGTPANQEERDSLIAVLDASFNEVLVGSSKVIPTVIQGFATVDGFFTNPMITVAPALPAGTYIIIHGIRSSLADIAKVKKSGFSYGLIRGSKETTAEVQRVLRDLHAPASLQSWNSAFDSTIRALAAAGLNERYRRQTTVPSVFVFDTAGDGAVISRDGQAPTASIPTSTFSADFSNDFADPFFAHWKATPSATAAPSNSSAITERRDGGTGFVSIVSRRNIISSASG